MIKQPRNLLAFLRTYKVESSSLGLAVRFSLCFAFSVTDLGMRDRSGLTFKSTNGLFVLHILAGILRHEYDGAEYNLLDCTVASENRRLWASGRLVRIIIRFNCTNVLTRPLHGLFASI